LTASRCGRVTSVGSTYTVVACSPSASGVPIASKIVPRPAGSTTGAFVCTCAIAESDEARTVAIHDARASSAPNASRMQSSSSRMREFTTRARPLLLLPEPDVARVGRRRWDIAEPVGCLLDALR
jgi:hypothetical protein